ncbi:putative Pyruvate kinase [Glarea lozoyensis 74030]|uniref:Pyruvate kinase n=1 Tax=Glarea lozoyensis (strain ATCC 74030 / MF5533) TaxID=1104152 RepID=H0EYQ8_GLAL7|nr:putative Pyruvate kinase [Glarea lozoyensis 74030]
MVTCLACWLRVCVMAREKVGKGFSVEALVCAGVQQFLLLPPVLLTPSPERIPSSPDLVLPPPSFSSIMATAMDHLSSGSTKIEWISALNTEYKPAKNYRRTSIICTIGPKTNSVEAINKLRTAGLNVVRMNFSHGSYEYHQSVIDNAREAEKVQAGRQIAIALDTKGPEIRTGNTKGDEDIPISAGTEINITTDEKYATACDVENMYVDYKNITKVIQKGRIIYVDDGVLAFDVLDIIDDKTIRARARNNGKISSKKGVNLPNTDVDLPVLSEKDQADLRFGVKNNVDMVFASFIRRGEDITAIRKILGEDGKNIQIIAKIENRQGLNNFAEILKETDGVMVARGDLGIEIPAAEVFAAQKKMIAMCNIAGKPVICATQMLESMINNPRPTRAEISDVGNAVTDGADCVMLSGETAKGSYPNEAVREMSETCLKAENTIAYVSHFEELTALAKRPVSIVESCAMAAVRASLDMNAGALIVLSTSGDSARLLSKYRPVCPIFMVTRNASASRYGHLYRGVYPFFFPEQKPDFSKVNWQEDVDRRIKWGIAEAMKLGVLSQGETVVVVQGWKGGMGNTNTLRVIKAEKDLGLEV